MEAEETDAHEEELRRSRDSSVIGLGQRWSGGNSVMASVRRGPGARKRRVFAREDGDPDSEEEDLFERPYSKAMRMWLIVPGGARKATWDWVLSTLAIYNLFTVPLELAFVTMPGSIELLVDLAFLVDMLISFRVVHFQRDGSPVLSHRQTALHCARSRHLRPSANRPTGRPT